MASANALRYWVAAARPKTLPLAITPVFAGVTLAAAQTGEMAWLTALLTLLVAVSIQIGTNMHNDAGDFERGTDTSDRVGPPRATAQGWLTARAVKRAANVIFLTGFIIGVILAFRGGWPIFWLGVVSIACGYIYTRGPRPIAYGPYGELFVLVFFGIAAVAGSHYLQTLTLGWVPIILGVAIGLPAAAVLLVNNYRDLTTDRLAGRRTLAHYLGERGARLAYAGMLGLTFVLLWTLPLPGAHWPLLLALPLALWLIYRLYRGAAGAALNAVLAQTAGLQLLLAILLAGGYAWPAGGS